MSPIQYIAIDYSKQFHKYLFESLFILVLIDTSKNERKSCC